MKEIWVHAWYRCGCYWFVRGLLLGWRKGLAVSLRSFSRSHIGMEAEEDDGRIVWCFTGLYGSPVEQARKDS